MYPCDVPVDVYISHVSKHDIVVVLGLPVCRVSQVSYNSAMYKYPLGENTGTIRPWLRLRLPQMEVLAIARM
jgi:hypothetical protein